MKTFDRFDSKKEAVSYIKESVLKDATSEQAAAYLRDMVPKESFYQRKIIEYLKKSYPQAFIWKAAAGEYSREGVPDICAIIDGQFYGFEVKRPYFGVVSKVQAQTMQEIDRAGGIVGVVTFPEDAEALIRHEKIF